jgi:DNA-directed RNA polymerase subunit F
MLSETKIKTMLDEKNIEYKEVKDFLYESKHEETSYEYKSMKRHSERVFTEIMILEEILQINQ